MYKTIHDGQFDHADLVQMEEHVLTSKIREPWAVSCTRPHRIYESNWSSPRSILAALELQFSALVNPARLVRARFANGDTGLAACRPLQI